MQGQCEIVTVSPEVAVYVPPFVVMIVLLEQTVVKDGTTVVTGEAEPVTMPEDPEAASALDSE